jgi:hypothetical protein
VIIYKNKAKSFSGYGAVLRNSDNWDSGAFRRGCTRLLGLFPGDSALPFRTYFMMRGMHSSHPEQVAQPEVNKIEHRPK